MDPSTFEFNTTALGSKLTLEGRPSVLWFWASVSWCTERPLSLRIGAAILTTLQFPHQQVGQQDDLPFQLEVLCRV